MTRFRDRVRFDVHTRAKDYADTPKLRAWLADMGVTGVRDNNWLGPTLLPGIAVQVVIDTTDPVAAATRADLAVKAGAVAVECLNEPLTAQAALAVYPAVVKAVAGRVPVVCSALGLPDLVKAKAIGPQPGTVMGNLHAYRANRTDADWAKWQARYMALLPLMAPFLPWQVTETGYHNYTGPNNHGHLPTPDDVAAAQIIPDMVGWFTQGATSVTFYQAFDQPALGDSSEAHFGLAGKPAAAALKAWLAEFGDYTDLSALDLAPAAAQVPMLTSKIQTALEALA